MTVMLPNISSAPKTGNKKLDSLKPTYNKPNPANIPPHPRIILANRTNIILNKRMSIHQLHSYILDKMTYVHNLCQFKSNRYTIGANMNSKNGSKS